MDVSAVKLQTHFYDQDTNQFLWSQEKKKNHSCCFMMTAKFQFCLCRTCWLISPGYRWRLMELSHRQCLLVTRSRSVRCWEELNHNLDWKWRKTILARLNGKAAINVKTNTKTTRDLQAPDRLGGLTRRLKSRFEKLERKWCHKRVPPRRLVSPGEFPSPQLFCFYIIINVTKPDHYSADRQPPSHVHVCTNSFGFQGGGKCADMLYLS